MKMNRKFPTWQLGMMYHMVSAIPNGERRNYAEKGGMQKENRSETDSI